MRDVGCLSVELLDGVLAYAGHTLTDELYMLRPQPSWIALCIPELTIQGCPASAVCLSDLIAGRIGTTVG